MGASIGSDDYWSDLFVNAALEPERWSGAIAAMARATGSSHGQLIGFGPGAAAFNWISDIDQALVARGAAPELQGVESNFRIAADAMADRPAIVHEAHYDLARTGLRSDAYLDLCSDFDIFEGCQTRLLTGPDSMIGLAVLRTAADGRTTVEQRAQFGRIAGHVRTAVRMQRAIEQKGFSLLADSFEAMERACWLIDGTGRIGAMTRQAQALLSEGRLRIDDGVLTGAHPGESRAIVRALRQVIDPPGRAADPVVLTDEAGCVDVLLEIFPLPAQPWSLPFAPRAIIVARRGMQADRSRSTMIRLFALTPAEADVAVRLANGQTRADIAAARGVSAETLKVQIRSIYDKTGCGRESQLVRLVGMLDR